MFRGTLVAAGVLLANPALAADVDAVVMHYADIALAGYGDSLATARDLNAAIDDLLAEPAPETLVRARDAWVAARVPYQQTEVYRFGNSIVDDWEGKVNAWPLDEGLIDYVVRHGDGAENPYHAANVIANPTLSLGGGEIDASVIDAALIASLHEIDNIEANVTTGYHAVEFLLWGQDLNGTGPGAGVRPWSDFSLDQCTGGNCDRRRAYLKAAADLLVQDLEEMAGYWASGGAGRAALAAGSGEQGLAAMLTGMGSLSYGELAGERMKLGLLLHDPEEEHDCFSDNTHNSHHYDAVGIRNVYVGHYVRVDGSVVAGPALSDLVRAVSPETDADLRAKLDAALAATRAMKDEAEAGHMSYDQMIGDGNRRGNAMVQAAVDALVEQSRSIQRVIAALGLEAIEFEGSDSLDSPEAVFQ